MIQPIGSSLTSVGLGQASPLLDRPGTQPQPTPPAVPAQGALQDHSPQAGLGLDNRDIPQYPGAPKSSLEKALESVNENLKAWSTGMRFDMDKDAQRLVISIVDTSTGKVLRTIPSEAVLQAAKMIVTLQGSGVDTRA